MADKMPDIHAIFNEAIELESEAERSKYVDEACQGDPKLISRVDGLLRAHYEAGGFLWGRSAAPKANIMRPISEEPGTEIGFYKLLQKIGEGGMGVVYMAEQTEPVSRKVALKIIKPGMDTRQVIARFEAERQALAMMDHPNIAKVFDAGTTDTGRPYFVMELVKGVAITEYCDEHQLSPRERLELFLPACQALQHAHQKGIIHRDIKPTNVMVADYDNRPVPKIIDFGVAKAIEQRLTEKTMFTEYGQVVGTMEYMSPEQAKLNQQDVDTRSDIYSLGVLLYELLTGETPFDGKRLRSAAFDELLRIIREEDPPRPSMRLSTSESLPSIAANRQIEPKQLSTLVHGELDWIVMKALEKDRTRRYDTASRFAEDVQNYLNDEAVEACPPSAAYRLRKFVRRNKVALATTAAFLVVLVLGIVGTSWQAIQANKERDKAMAARIVAEHEAAVANAVNEFLNSDLLSQSNPANEPDRDIKLRIVLDAAAQKVTGRFKEQPLVEAAIRDTIGTTYQSLGEFETAQEHFERAVQIRQRELGIENSLTLSTSNQLGAAMLKQGMYIPAEKLLREVLEIQKRVLGPEHIDTLGTANNLANAISHQGRFSECKTIRQSVFDSMTRVHGPEHPRTLVSKCNLGITAFDSAQYGEAERLFTETLAVQRRVLGSEHPDTLRSMHNQANAIKAQGRTDEAEKLLQKLLPIKQRVLGPDHLETLSSMNQLAKTIMNLDRHAEAENLFRETHEIQKRVLGLEHPDALCTMHNLACTLSRQGRASEAEEVCRQVLKTRNRILGPAHINTLMSAANLAAYMTFSSDDESVLAEIEQVADASLIRAKTESDTKRLGEILSSLAGNLSNSAWQLVTHPDPKQRHPQMAVRLSRISTQLQPDTANHWDNLGVALYRNGRWNEAIEALEKASEMRGGKDSVHQFFLAMAYWKADRHEEAVENYVLATTWLARKSRAAEQYRFRDEAKSLIRTTETEKATQEESEKSIKQ